MAGPAQLDRRDLSDEKTEKLLLKAIRAAGGVATESDLVVASGIPAAKLGPAMRKLLIDYDARLEVRDDGAIVYRFSPDVRPRKKDRNAWQRFKGWVWRGFKKTYKATIAIVLVGYVVLFVALMVAAYVAMMSQRQGSDNNRGGFGRGRAGGDGPGFWFWYWAFGRDRSARGLYSPRSSRWARDSDPGKDTRPFYKKVYSFVFGAEEGEVEELFTERELLAWIRSQGGVVSPTELASRTGWSIETAEKESTRLLAYYDGDVEVTSDGSVLYVFDELMQSAGTAGDARPAPAFWERFERKETVTGNTGSANAGIGALNLFVLFSALVAVPGFIAPYLGLDLSNAATWFGLLGFPALYSVMFFLVPLMRRFFVVAPENKRRAKRNLRRAVMRQVFAWSSDEAKLMDDDQAVDLIAKKIPASVPVTSRNPKSIEKALREVAAEFDAYSEIDSDGSHLYRFDRIADEARAAQRRRSNREEGKRHSLGEQGLAFERALQSGRKLEEEYAELAANEAVAEALDDW